MDLAPAEVERLAAVEHERYRSESASGSGVASLPYDDLPDGVREANRASVRGIPALLGALGYELCAEGAGRPPVRSFRAEEVEQGARLEHLRWLRWMAEQGYRHGAERDPVARTHPDMVPWEELDEDARDKDRQRIRALPGLVREVGLVVVPKRR